MRGYGFEMQIVQRHKVEDGINAVRQAFPRLWIDSRLTDLIEALRQYRYEWDDRRQVLKENPLHDWTSHACDAVRTGCTTRRKQDLNLRRGRTQGSWMAI
jgi:hypothetical protein